MSKLAPKRHSLWIIAGPNGSGETSVYQSASVDEPTGSVWIINPDLLARTIREKEMLEATAANLAAVQRIGLWLDASLDTYQTIGVETVLSTRTYCELVAKAKEREFEIRLVHVFLDSVELNLERVRIRVLKGGHDVPSDKIRDRRLRSFAQFGWFLNAADRADVFDNSGASSRLMMSKRGDKIEVYDDIDDEMVTSLDTEIPGFRTLYDEDA